MQIDGGLDHGYVLSGVQTALAFVLNLGQFGQNTCAIDDTNVLMK